MIEDKKWILASENFVNCVFSCSVTIKRNVLFADLKGLLSACVIYFHINTVKVWSVAQIQHEGQNIPTVTKLCSCNTCSVKVNSWGSSS